MSSYAPQAAPATAATTITTTTAEADATTSSPSSTMRANMPSKLMSISTKTVFTTSTTVATPNHDDQPSSSSASVSSPSSSNSPSSLSPATPAPEMPVGLDALSLSSAAAAPITTPPLVDNDVVVTPCAQQVKSKDEASSDTETLEAVTATLHKKDSGTSMGSSVVSSPLDSCPSTQAAFPPDDNSCPTSPTEPAPAPTTTGARRFSQSDTSSIMSPAGRVLTRPLSTSKLSSIALTAPHILPNQRYAGFNLAAFGQLSPSSSTAAMTISRADSLAFLNSNSAGSNPNPYFGLSAAAMKGAASGGGVSTPSSLMEGIMSPSSGVTRTTMCGSDAISLLDLDDSHNDIVMIDSNGNSSGSAVVGPATVVETMASASAIVSNNHASASHHHTLGGAAQGLVAGLGGLTTAVSSASLLTGGGGLGGSGGVSGSGSATSVLGGGSAFGSGSSSGSNISHPRSSLPSLTSQAKKDVMQRAAMLAAMQQNGGAKILGAHRVGRRQDRPNRKIRFGDFHKICEIEYGFDQGKPLMANGRTLVHSTVLLRICGDEEREEQLYLFSDVLVTGTKIRKGKPKSTESATEAPDIVAMAADGETLKNTCADDFAHSGDRQQGLVATVEESIEEMVVSGPDAKAEKIVVEVSVKESFLDNPYAGHLENQQISRLTQVQADVVEGDERPMLKVSMPQSTSVLIFESTTARDNFMSLLTETIYAHKHYLLSQSKYLADLKKFKRHSAFSFDTSFLKTWGIPGGLNLGSLKPAGGGSSGHGVIGPNTFTSSPVASPGGSAFDPYQHQQHLNRPQSMAGSLFGFALNGGPFQPFSDHSKESSYATLRGANATHALHYHHQQQQMLQQQLQNRLSMSSVASGRTGMDRTSSGSTFDALWFMKGGETVKNRKSVVHGADDERELPAEEGSIANTDTDGPTTTTIKPPPSSSSAGSPSLTVNTGAPQSKSSSGVPASRPSLSTSSSFSSIATLRNGAGWVRDEDATYCMVCTTTKFGVLIRKHHCRLCGRVICWKCCQMKDAVLLNNSLGGEQGLSPTEAAAMSQDFRKPIRVCLDCIEQNAASQENNNQPSQPTSPQQQQAHSPLSSSFPLQGVLGKLMSSTMTSSPQIVTLATNATGSSTFAMPQTAASSQAAFQQRGGQGSTPSPFYPRLVSYGRNGHPYPHHHRASLYRIDVERVGEEDEEEEEEEEEDQEVAELLQKADEALESLVSPQPDPSSQEEDSDTSHLMINDSSTSKSRHGSVHLKDLDPEDINEEEVQNQIMNLESEVESLLIQSAAAPLMFARSTGGSRHQREGGTGAGKTRVIRGIPKEMMLQYGSGGGGAHDNDEDDEEDNEEEEVTMEELLAQQDERFMQILT